MDKISDDQRSYNMSQIRGKNTKPELFVRKYLHSRGFRFRLHDSKLPGNPDIVLPKYQSVIFVNGCFWHGHRNCTISHVPKTRTEYWANKINRNIGRDESNYSKLREIGWNIFILWECELLQNPELIIEALISQLKAIDADK
ncbi:MAG: very short patch repair endonuclease [Syntrophomonadaceae bacterium]